MNQLKQDVLEKKKSSLLLYSSITIENEEYMIFRMYQCHSRIDFKSIVYLVEEFLNLFDETYISSSLISISSYYDEYLSQQCSPTKECHEQIIKETPHNILTFDFTTLKEKEMIFRDIKKGYYPHLSETMKLSPEETKKLITYCKQH